MSHLSGCSLYLDVLEVVQRQQHCICLSWIPSQSSRFIFSSLLKCVMVSPTGIVWHFASCRVSGYLYNKSTDFWKELDDCVLFTLCCFLHSPLLCFCLCFLLVSHSMLLSWHNIPQNGAGTVCRVRLGLCPKHRACAWHCLSAVWERCFKHSGI